MDAPGRLGRDARRALAGDRAQDVDVVRGEVDGHPDVADARRERTGATARDGEDRATASRPRAADRARGSPGLNRSMWPTWTGGAPGADAAATIWSASAGVAASGFSTRTAMPRSIAARVSGRWLVVGAAMTTASRSASASIASGSLNACAPDPRAGRAEGDRRRGRRRRPAGRPAGRPGRAGGSVPSTPGRSTRPAPRGRRSATRRAHRGAPPAPVDARRDAAARGVRRRRGPRR